MHQIFWVVIDAGFAKNFGHFFLKRHTSVMLTLVLYIRLYGRDKRSAIRECPVTRLPRKIPVKKFFVYPSCRMPFQFLYQRSYAFRRVHSDKQMNVVGSAANGVNEMFPVLTGSSQIFIQFVDPIVGDESLASRYGEDNVHIDLRIGVSHCVVVDVVVDVAAAAVVSHP